jgi:asparagine synthase (glutamine-hydrolysing)
VNAFVCLIGTPAAPIESTYTVRIDAAATRTLGGSLQWAGDRLFSFGLHNDTNPAPARARRHAHISVVGIARFDNARRLASQYHLSDGIDDVGIAARVLATEGVAAIRLFHGDFAIVVRDHRTQDIFAIRDAIGVRPLYATADQSPSAIGSHASLIGADHDFDRSYLLDYLIGQSRDATRSAFAGVRSIEPGHIATIHGRRDASTPFWEADRRTYVGGRDVSSTIDTFRTLFDEAVQSCLTSDGRTWSLLSGGQDSSAVVVTAADLARRGRVPAGLGGTLTIVDSLTKVGDERVYSQAVAKACGVANVEIDTLGPWYDDGAPPPFADQPSDGFPLYAMQRAMQTTLRAVGATVVVGGAGADEYLSCKQPLFLTDLMVRGHLVAMAAEAMRWSAAQRKSVWRTAYSHLLLPVLPAAARRRTVARADRLPHWVARAPESLLALQRQSDSARYYPAASGDRYGGYMARKLRVLASSDLTAGLQGIDVRHPFLYRPLVEFSLALPYWLRSQPGVTKWILREAMALRLPEQVRARRRKSTFGPQMRLSLANARNTVDSLLDKPILADLGCIEPGQVREYVNRIERGSSQSIAPLFRCLSLEFWLRVHTGRWAARNHYPEPSLRIA